MAGYDDDFDPLAPVPAPQQSATEPEPDEPEDDLLAAPFYGIGAADVEEEDFDESDGGVSDYEGIVRIWVQDGRLDRVRLSPVWFHKLADAAALERCFQQALRRAALQIPEDPDPETQTDHAGHATEPEITPEVAERLRDLPELSRRSLALFDALGTEMDQRHAEVIAAHQPAASKSAVVAGKSKGVTVTLNTAGVADSVQFDPKWLDDAHVGAICTHIMIAAERAYARYQPAQDVEDPVLAEVAAERAVYQQALRIMLTPRSMRH